MKYLKTFENFGEDMGRFSDEEENAWLNEPEAAQDEEECDICDMEDDEFEEEDEFEEGEDLEDEMEEEEGKIWGDEIVEKKKTNDGRQKFLDKQKAKGAGKQVNKDNKKDDKKDDKNKGLSASQKKLPKALQDAILKRKKR